MQLREITFQRFEEEAERLNVALPIEQTAAWARYEQTIEGRSQWGCFKIIDENDETVALISFADYLTHGYHYLRAHHGPVWVEEPTPEQEQEALDAIADYVSRRDRSQVFVRLSVKAELPCTHAVLSGVPYDTTVVIDVTGGAEAILSRMKSRGRRDVRKALREAPIDCADETDRALISFSEYYDVMVETAERDGFSPAPMSDYESMLQILGPEHCRVFAGRDADGQVVTWSIVTIQDKLGVRYYAASRNATMRQHVTDKLLYFECCQLGQMGCEAYDLMAIGSEFSPTLMGLNEFKTKFTTETTPVAPDRDLPLRKTFYDALQSLQSARRSYREAAEAKEAKEAARNAEPRKDLLPVVVGGDISAYSYAREFHEAYHVKTALVSSGFIAALQHSEIVSLVQVEQLSAESLKGAIVSLAEANPDKSLPVVASTDSVVAMLDQIRNELPANVVLTIPSHDALVRSEDKASFAEACASVGLRTPQTEVVHLGASEDANGTAGATPAPTSLAFPVVAKAARSADYSMLYAQGFKKVYLIQEQSELDDLWARLAEVGFTGDFLVQELIGGDDAHMGFLTFYVDTDGRMRLFGAAQTLLEDHAPSMRGNAVAALTRVWPELQKDCEALVAALGYTGFGEIDIKLDPITCEWVFLELNPRIGRNAYTVDAAGINPMHVMVDDLVDHRGYRLLVADEPALYTLVPVSLVRRYVVDPGLVREVDELVKQGKVVDPQRYELDTNACRMLNVELTEQNQRRKFRRFYPRLTETSF